MSTAIGYLITYLYIFFILIFISSLNKRKAITNETSRKLIHILVGLSWFIMVYFFKSSWHLIIPPLTFIIMNTYFYKKQLIQSMQKENSKGTIYYAISFAILSFITIMNPNFLPFYGIGALSMTLADGTAPFIGKKFNKIKIGKTSKTLAGSLTIFLCILTIIILFNTFYHLEINLLKILILSIIGVILELFSKDFDNLTLPICIAIISYLI